ncbi:MAG TPA: hypothetical protein VFE50_13590 [Cyclobacteriaceae bacterium]|nr:hypothetical protein [Cyclobacteriaceae bacterium]
MHQPPAARISLLLAVFLFTGFVRSLACTCPAQATVPAAYDGSTIVFTGKVLKVEYHGLAETLNPDSVEVARSLPHESSKSYLDAPMVLKATMLVTNEFKGVKKKDTIIVYTGIRGATCGFKFETNKEYTVYGTTENYMYMFLRVDRKRFRTFSKRGVYWTSICSRTTVAVGMEQGLLNDYLKSK